MIYFDNAATTPISDEAMKQFIKWNEQYGNSESVYQMGREASEMIETARKTIAKLIGAAEPKNVIFTSGGCEGNSTAIKSMVLELYAQGKRINIALAGTEHHSVINSVKWAEKYFGAKLFYYPLTNGRIDVEKVKETRFFETRHINVATIIWGNNETGAIQNELTELIKEAKTAGAKVHVDAVQIVPHLGLTVLQKPISGENGADFVTFSGHKIGAPKGIGVLYCADLEHLIPLIEGGEQEAGKRGGTLNNGLIAGLSAAVEKINAPENSEIYFDFRPYFEFINENLIKTEGLSLNNPSILTETDCFMGIINIDCKVESGPIVAYLDNFGICASTGSACNGGGNYSYVLEQLGLNPTTSLRVSLSPNVTMDEIMKFIEIMKRYFCIIKELVREEHEDNGSEIHGE